MSSERLYAPWRMNYITATHKKDIACVFCAIINDGTEKDRENFIIYRGKNAFAVMNLYPYNTGHLMVLPYTHTAVLADVSYEMQAEIMALTSYFSTLLSQLMQPDGFNIGMNIGRSAGAGIACHLHMHIVPRWEGDNNFMPVINQTRVMPEDVQVTYNKIIALLEKHPPKF